MPISQMVARWLTNQGQDAVHAIDLNLDRAPDTAILAHAAQDARTVVTADLDYPRLLALSQATEPSLILFRHGNWNEADVTARLTDVLAGMTEIEITQSILVVDKDRVRRRRLPLA
jgi:predicted nuclease of predicted toxin-antitoxin system